MRGRWWVWQEYLFWGQSYFSGPPTTDFFSWTVPHTPSRLPHQSAWHVLHRAFLQKKPQVRPPNRTTKPVRLKESHQISLYHLKISEVNGAFHPTPVSNNCLPSQCRMAGNSYLYHDANRISTPSAEVTYSPKFPPHLTRILDLRGTQNETTKHEEPWYPGISPRAQVP